MKVSKSLLRSLYRSMVRIRLAEESLVDPILRGEIRCPCHLYSGQEAIAAGLGACLNERDYVFGNHRSHGHFLAKGGGMNELIAEIFCRQTGSARGRGGSMHLIDPEVGMLGAAPIVAGTISLALGAALATKIRRERRVTVSFFGDGATGEGVLYESLNFAALKKLPLLFACENNLYATHMPIGECRVASAIHRVAAPFCVESRVVDGNDVLKVYETARWAVGRCRKGQGPVFLEFRTYRFRGHVGPDDNIQGSHTDIRPQSEVRRWLQKDPIKRFERYLTRNGILDARTLHAIRDEAQAEVEAAHAFAQASPLPAPEELTDYVYR